MTEIVKINIDLNNGAVNIEASDQALDKVFDRLESFLPSLIDAKDQFGTGTNADGEDADQDTVDERVESEAKSGSQSSKPKAKGKKSSSTKPETFKTVELGLSADQRQSFKDFYAEKSPKGQSDHVLTVIYWLIKNTDKESLTKDEIFTGLRTVNEKAPKRLSSVLSNLALASYITKNGADSGIHHIGEDYIEHELPKGKD